MPTDQIRLLKEENIDYNPLINKLYELAIKHEFLRVDVQILKRMSEQESYGMISEILFNLVLTGGGWRFDGTPTEKQPSKEQLIKCLQHYHPEEDMRLDISLSRDAYDALLHFSPEDRKFIVEESESELLEEESESECFGDYCEGNNEDIDNFIKEMTSISLSPTPEKHRVFPKRPPVKTFFHQTNSQSPPTDAFANKAKPNPGIPLALIDKIYEHAVKDDSVFIEIKILTKGRASRVYRPFKQMLYNPYTTGAARSRYKVNQPSKEALIEMMQHYHPEKDMSLQIFLSSSADSRGCPCLEYASERQEFDVYINVIDDERYHLKSKENAGINDFIKGVGAVIPYAEINDFIKGVRPVMPSSAIEEEAPLVKTLVNQTDSQSTSTEVLAKKAKAGIPLALIDKIYEHAVKDEYVNIYILISQESIAARRKKRVKDMRYNFYTTGAARHPDKVNQPSKEALIEMMQRYNPEKDMSLEIYVSRYGNFVGYPCLTYSSERQGFVVAINDFDGDWYDLKSEENAGINAFIKGVGAVIPYAEINDFIKGVRPVMPSSAIEEEAPLVSSGPFTRIAHV